MIIAHGGPSLKRRAHVMLRAPGIISRTAAYALLHEPEAMRPWVSSLLPGRYALADQVPWMPFKARIWLESYLTPSMTAFEYGSGGSTLFLSKRIGSLVSVEHDVQWHALVAGELARQGIQNCQYLLAQPEPLADGATIPYSPYSYTSTRPEYEGQGFESYVKTIDCCPDESLDLIIVDGRARSSCVTHALSKVRPGGYLLLDDSNRQRYAEARKLLDGYERLDFFGPCPYEKKLQQTSAWKIV